MSDAQDRRAAALQCACRAVPVGSPVGHFFSTARMFDRYITTGLSKSGTGETQGLEVGAEGVSVRVDGQITDKDADDLARALRYVLAGRLVPAEGGRL